MFPITTMKKALLLTTVCMTVLATASAQGPHRRFPREPFTTESPLAHDPVMAKEDDTYYVFATGMGIQQLTSKDRKTWTVLPQPVMTVIPGWTVDSVPGFAGHVWAPDIIRWHDRWWLAYSCSTFGKNGSAIGLLSSRSLRSRLWKDEGCIVASHERKRGDDGQMSGDNWNAIDPNFVIDDTDTPWLVWGSFWDGIQLARLDSTMHLARGGQPRTIARRHAPGYESAEPNPTSRYAGTNAIEAPFIFRHGGYYYLFVSWDYCCLPCGRGAQRKRGRPLSRPHRQGHGQRRRHPVPGGRQKGMGGRRPLRRLHLRRRGRLHLPRLQRHTERRGDAHPAAHQVDAGRMAGTVG